MSLASTATRDQPRGKHYTHFYICDPTGKCVRGSPLTALQGQQLTASSGEIWQAHGLPADLGPQLQQCLHKVPRTRETVRILITGGSPGHGAPVVYACQFMPATLEDDTQGVALQIQELPSAPQTSEVAVTKELLDAVPTPMVVIRVSDWKCLYANAAAAALFGVTVSELIGHNLAAFFGQASDPVRILERLVVDRKVTDFESHIIDREGNRQRMVISGGCAFSEGSQVGMLVIKPADAHNAPAIADARDALTGLLNRNALTDRLQDAIRRAASLNRIVAVLFIDLNRFKAINDQHGHLIGDQLLAIIASRLAGCVRHYETVARLGGDEFGIILDGLMSSQEAARVSQDVQRVVSLPVSLGSLSLRVTASVGIAFYPIDAPTASHLIHAAEQAMYQQKAPHSQAVCNGRGREAQQNS